MSLKRLTYEKLRKLRQEYDQLTRKAAARVQRHHNRRWQRCSQGRGLDFQGQGPLPLRGL